MLLRLDPAHPPLWRSATTLQFGADAVAVINEPTLWQQRLIGELERGIPEVALDPVAMALGAPEDAAEEFLRRIAAALRAPEATPRHLRLQVPYGMSQGHARLIAAALAQTGAQVSPVEWFGAPDEEVEGGDPVVLLAHHVLEPRRAAALMGGDTVHVPLILTGGGAEVGPVVRPGHTACLACVAAHRRDADPAWPQIAAQLMAQKPPQLPEPVLAEAALTAVRLLSESAPTPDRSSTSLVLAADSSRRGLAVHHPHAECRCRSLGGSATADAPAPRATTTSSALARPA